MHVWSNVKQARSANGKLDPEYNDSRCDFRLHLHFFFSFINFFSLHFQSILWDELQFGSFFPIRSLLSVIFISFRISFFFLISLIFWFFFHRMIFISFLISTPFSFFSFYSLLVVFFFSLSIYFVGRAAISLFHLIR